MNDKLDIYFSKVFCRMRHKTQLFNGAADDHYHTRLQHTIEVEEIALRMAKRIMRDNPKIKCDLSKVSAIALLHDIGHTPFGHAGEKALHEIVSGQCSKQYCLPDFKELGVAIGFKHNINSGLLYIENTKYRKKSYEILDGIVKHTKLRHDENDSLDYGFEYIFHGHNKYYNDKNPLTLEGFIVAYADEIGQICSDYLDICLDARSNDLELDFNCPPYNRIRTSNYDKRRNADRACNYLIKLFCACYKNSGSFKSFDKNSFTNLIRRFGKYRTNYIRNNESISSYDEEKKHVIKSLFAFYYLHPENITNDFFGDFIYRVTGKIRFRTSFVFNDAKDNLIVDESITCSEKDRTLMIQKMALSYIEKVKLIVEENNEEKFSKARLKDYKSILKIFIRSLAVHISKMTDNYADHKYKKILDKVDI